MGNWLMLRLGNKKTVLGMGDVEAYIRSFSVGITGSIMKNNGEVFTETEKEKLIDDFLEFLSSKELNFFGSAG